jgi:hypothetical protein
MILAMGDVLPVVLAPIRQTFASGQRGDAQGNFFRFDSNMNVSPHRIEAGPSNPE